MTFAAASGDVALAFIELGAVILGLSVVARASDQVGLSPVPAYLAAGLLLGEGGVLDSAISEDFIDLGAEIGVVLLLFALGLEYTSEELTEGLRSGRIAGAVDVVANFTPGLGLGLLLGWDAASAMLLGGVTYISSSGIAAKVLGDLGRLGNRETPTILTMLVFEDLVMAAYLPVVGVVLAGDELSAGAVHVAIALSVTALVLASALRYGDLVSRLMHTRSDEALLLGVLGLVLLVAGAAQAVDVSAAIGAFLVGIALSGSVQERASALVGPLRDLFAAVFFVLFGLRIDASDLPPVLVVASLLAIVTAATKFWTGWWAAGRRGIGMPGRVRAGSALVARGEFSIVIAGLAVGTDVDPDLVPLAAAYVLLLAVLGPVLVRLDGEIIRALRLRRPPGPVLSG